MVFQYGDEQPQTLIVAQSGTLSIFYTKSPACYIDPNALTIMGASYGLGNVTEKVASLVTNNCFHAMASNDVFGDTWYGVVKTLVVVYMHLGVSHISTVDEHREMVINVTKAFDQYPPNCPLSCAFSVEGSDLSIGSTRELGFHESFTVTVWIKLDRIGTPTNYENCIIGQNNGVAMGCLHLLVRRGNPYMGFYTADVTSPTQLSLDVWYHLAFVYDMKMQTQSIFVDGHRTVATGSRRPLQGDQSVYLSQYIERSRKSGLDGQMSSLRIYRRALPPAEIAQFMFLGVPSGLVWAEDKSGLMADITPPQLTHRLVSDYSLYEKNVTIAVHVPVSLNDVAEALNRGKKAWGRSKIMIVGEGTVELAKLHWPTAL